MSQEQLATGPCRIRRDPSRRCVVSKDSTNTLQSYEIKCTYRAQLAMEQRTTRLDESTDNSCKTDPKLKITQDDRKEAKLILIIHTTNGLFIYRCACMFIIDSTMLGLKSLAPHRFHNQTRQAYQPPLRLPHLHQWQSEHRRRQQRRLQ